LHVISPCHCGLMRLWGFWDSKDYIGPSSKFLTISYSVTEKNALFLKYSEHSVLSSLYSLLWDISWLKILVDYLSHYYSFRIKKR
jgi:hypothetical protein